MSDSEDNSFSSEDETVSKNHNKLLRAVGSLGKVQHIRKISRKEPSSNQNEFELIKPRLELPKKVQPTKSAVSVVDLVNTLKGTSKHLKVGKELKNVANSTKILPKPLEKPEADRVSRSINYEKTKKDLQRWDAVVAQFQSAESQTFPLNSETVYINTAKLKKPLPLSMKSELQIAVEEAEAKLRALKGEKRAEITDADLLNEKMMLTKEEIKKRRQELLHLKMREQQKSAKLRLQNKIKSKKYHRLAKQHKLKEQLKDFETLQKTNPQAALEKLESLEKNRILERANLRHKNTGTWAKNNLVKAKYNRDIQKDLSEQLALSRQLTEKKDISDDDEEMKSDDDADLDFANDSNPWMQANGKKADDEKIDAVEVGYRKYWLERKENEKKLRNHQAIVADDSGIGTESKNNKKQSTKPVKRKKKEPNQQAALIEDSGIEAEIEETERKPTQSIKKKKNKKNKSNSPVVLKNGWIVEDVKDVDDETDDYTIDKLFDKAEDTIQRKLTKKQQQLQKRLAKEAKRKQKKENSRRPKGKDELKNLQNLKFKKQTPTIEIDEQLLETSKGEEPVLPSSVPTTNLPPVIPRESLASDSIKHDNYANVKPKALRTSLAELTNIGEDVDFDDDNDEDIALARQATINDAFEDDDIVADFGKEKSADEKRELSDQITLTMPGWGSWAGSGISQNKNKRKNLTLDFGKAAAEKKDENGNKSRVRINENVNNKKLREHLVSDVPFPFTSVKDYEASIRAPIGRDYVPETAFRMLTKPAVITKKGQIIRPMDESELTKPNKRVRSVVEKRILYDTRVASQ